MIRDTSALDRAMIAAGVRDFAGGLQPVGKAKSVCKHADGEVVISDGGYLEAKEHVGGLWLMSVPTCARPWSRRARPPWLAGCRWS
jgi:hypothetical protein